MWRSSPRQWLLSLRGGLSRVWFPLSPIGCPVDDEVCGVRCAEKTTQLGSIKRNYSYSRQFNCWLTSLTYNFTHSANYTSLPLLRTQQLPELYTTPSGGAIRGTSSTTASSFNSNCPIYTLYAYLSYFTASD